jgi:hypothetical protein
MAYTAEQMAAQAEQHYNEAKRLAKEAPTDLASIAESLAGLLAMQLANYANQPIDLGDPRYGR